MSTLPDENILSETTLWSVLRAVADTHAPSQTVADTRAPVLAHLFKLLGAERLTFERNYMNSGAAVAFVGDSTPAPQILVLAHADELSYLSADQSAVETSGRYPLEAFGSDRAVDAHAAIALRWNREQQRLSCVARGEIRRTPVDVVKGEIRRTAGDVERPLPVFVPTSGSMELGDRCVYHHPLTLDDRGLLRGSLDNAAGVSACVLAATALSRMRTPVSVAFAFPDEEEGPAIDNIGFSRGARRLLRKLEPTVACVNVDGHDLSPGSHLGGGAVFALRSSHFRGAVTPPRLWSDMKEVAARLAGDGVRLVANGGYVSRSDDVAAAEALANVILLGYPISDPHFNHAAPSAAISDLTHLARAMVSAIGFLASSIEPLSAVPCINAREPILNGH
jgi:hypothetical protein